MAKASLFAAVAAISFVSGAALLVGAQERPPRESGTPATRPSGAGSPRDFFRGGPPPFGPGGFMGQKRALVKQFDKDGDERLNKEERQAAREAIKKDRAAGPGGRGFGRPGGWRGPAQANPATRPAGDAFGPPPVGFGPPGGFGMRRNQEPPKPGPRVSPADVKEHPEASLYEPTVLRTLFLEFEDADWEAELADFKGTDVEVPATLTVDGRKYPNVGVHFRGLSSYMSVSAGYKRSLNLSLDYVDSTQRLYGYKTLNLLNAHEDPSFLHTVLYSHIARQYIPAPKANLVKVVINGESWGVYVNAQQYNKEFLKDWFSSAKGVRWSVPGSPGGRGGLAYTGDDVEDYKRVYEIKCDDPEKAEKAWKDLIALCRTLKETPPDRLEEALTPILDVEGVLWFLALENVLINGDGYWIRASDYHLFRDGQGKFHIIPHDMNESFQPGMGPGFGGPGGLRGFGGPGGRSGGSGPMTRPAGEGLTPAGNRPGRDNLRGLGGLGGPGGPGTGGGGVEVDPLAAVSDTNKALLCRLLAVPSLKKRYLQNVRTIAEVWLDWNRLQPIVEQYRSLIQKEVEADTHKLQSLAEFTSSLGLDETEAAAAGNRRREMSLKAFAGQRRAYLLSHPEIKKLER